MKRIVIIVALLAVWFKVCAQDKVLTLDEYLAIVAKYHPVALQAKLNNDKARFTKQQALGGFDPKLEVDKDRKIFAGKTYYDFLTPEVKVPLWYGIDIKGSYTKVTGQFVNPEDKTPDEGLGYLGLSIPLGKGLFLDDRRAALKQANLYSKTAANEQRQMLNDLFVAAASTYSEWLNAYLNTLVYKKAVNLAKTRFDGTRMLYKNGDKPAIDTLEALTLLQTRNQKLAEYQLLLQNRKNELASYMWQESLSAVDVNTLNVLPDTTLTDLAIPDSVLNKTAGIITKNHPEIANYTIKLSMLDLERRLKLEELKPTLNFNLGVLNTGKNIFNNITPAWIANNQKLGFNVALPLTFTKQRASYKMAKLKLQEAQLSLLDKQNSLSLKWNNYKNDYYNIQNQIKFNSEIQKNNQGLLTGEEHKFKLGESSVFMVNSREQKVLDTMEKLNEYYTKRLKTIQYLKWLSNDFLSNSTDNADTVN